MTTTVLPVVPAEPGATVGRKSILALAGIEARRNLRSPLLLVVLVFSALSLVNMNGADWSGGIYSMLPLYFVPLAAGTFLLGLRSAGRDHRADLPPLVEDCALYETVRTAGRLLGLVVFPACGHTPNIEEPGLFNLHVTEFLASVERGRWAGWSA